jgi:signal transduction histidine kinase
LVTSPATAANAVGRAIWTGRSVADLALDSLPVGVLIASPEGDRANPELHRIWRRPLGAPFQRRTLARSLEPLPPRSRGGRPTSASAPARPLTVALGGRTVSPSRYRLRRDDGSTAVVRITAAPIVDAGRTVGAVLVATDESGQHDMERLRDAFLGILGHELRTPTTAIVGGSELLADTGLSADIRAEVAATLVEEATRLNRLVDQLLRLAALEGRDDVALEPVAVGHVVRRVARRLSERLPKATIEMSIERGLPPIAADEGYVEQVVGILLDNAVKHAGGSHWIGVRVVQAGSDIAVHLLDDGTGLPLAGRDALFRLFHRGPAAGSSAGGGTGIGLFVADAIVRAMGGRIWAENRAEGGADVGFALPIAED